MHAKQKQAKEENKKRQWKRRHVTRTHASNVFFRLSQRIRQYFFSFSFTSIPINQISTAAGKQTQREGGREWAQTHTHTYLQWSQQRVQNLVVCDGCEENDAKNMWSAKGAHSVSLTPNSPSFATIFAANIFHGRKISSCRSFRRWKIECEILIVHVDIVRSAFRRRCHRRRHLCAVRTVDSFARNDVCGFLCAFINLTGFKRSKNDAAAANHRNSRCRRHLP